MIFISWTSKTSLISYILNFKYIKILFEAITLNVLWIFNLLKPTGHVMHQQFNIQQL